MSIAVVMNEVLKSVITTGGDDMTVFSMKGLPLSVTDFTKVQFKINSMHLNLL